MLIAKYNKFDQSVEIGDLNNPSDGWVTYDPTQGASSEELTEICNTLYDRCLLAELGIKGFTPAGCLLYTSPSPRDPNRSRMPSSA